MQPKKAEFVNSVQWLDLLKVKRHVLLSGDHYPSLWIERVIGLCWRFALSTYCFEMLPPCCLPNLSLRNNE